LTLSIITKKTGFASPIAKPVEISSKYRPDLLIFRIF
jgi:hypothetical protein